MRVILEIPVNVIRDKIDGVDTELLEMRGLWTVRGDGQQTQQISNPLVEWAHTGENPAGAFKDNERGNVRICLRLVPANVRSNPGQDDDAPSLIHDDYRL